MRPWLRALPFFASLPLLSQKPEPKVVLTQYERPNLTVHKDQSCKYDIRRSLITSKLTVFDNLDAVYETKELSFCDGDSIKLPIRGTEWELPSGETRRFQYKLSAEAYRDLRQFLERADVKALQGFMNAGGGVGDFKIVINRIPRDQEILVLSLLPDHMQLIRDPSLLHLICKAKEFAEVASFGADPRPDWCLDLQPFTEH